VHLLDSWAVVCLLPVAVWLLLSGLDDLFVDAAWLYGWMRGRINARHSMDLDCDTRGQILEKPIAMFLPLWRESSVIERMLKHNTGVIRYRNYCIFAGTYPNDPETRHAVERAAAHIPNLYVSVCPEDGPTSKADCLNSIYRRMLAFEEEQGVRFEVIVQHDAEDLIHSDAFHWINSYTETYDMVQVPVLPLPTPGHELTHGAYCDEFAETQTRDLPVRQLLGGFIPSCGVGTGYSRWAIDRLAELGGDQVFEPASLTEDYEVGLRLHGLRCLQLFLPLRVLSGRPGATREFFPRAFRQAVRQRTRWVTGIALQSWERYGWRGGLRQVYWFWRDRKGLIGLLASFLANVLLFYGGARLAFSMASGTPWGLPQAVGHYGSASVLFTATCALQLHRTAVRAACSGRIYGWRFALGAPLRIVWGNWINFFATASALRRFFTARLRHRPLVWLKTEHTYPCEPQIPPGGKLGRQLGDRHYGYPPAQRQYRQLGRSPHPRTPVPRLSRPARPQPHQTTKSGLSRPYKGRFYV
jgi:bacteriophage N4 adsorption protein B